MPATPTLLLVDDDAAFLQDLGDLLQATLSARIVTATSGASGLDALAGGGVDLIISDRNMPGMDGLAFLQSARARDPTVPRILMTGDLAFQGHAERLTAAKPCEIIAKPPQSSRTLDAVRRL